MSWNVTLIRPSGYVHAHALDDVATYLDAMLRQCGETSRCTTNHLAYDETNLVVGAHLLAAHAHAQLPASTIIFNSEPSFEWAPPYRALLARSRVWDYSLANSHHDPPRRDRTDVIAFGYCAALRRDRVHLPGDALVFYGSMTPRRARVVAELRARGLLVETLFGVYGAERDARMFAARAVLNLHKTDDDAWFEPVRCFYPLINGVPVISEDTRDPSGAAFRGSMAFDLCTLVDPAPFAAISGEASVRSSLSALRTRT